MATTPCCRYAFGLEETGDYAEAETYGRAGVELEPRDAWGWHAVVHVMRNDPAAGVQWLQPQSGVWSRDSFFTVHNWWHLALFIWRWAHRRGAAAV